MTGGGGARMESSIDVFDDEADMSSARIRCRRVDGVPKARRVLDQLEDDAGGSLGEERDLETNTFVAGHLGEVRLFSCEPLELDEPDDVSVVGARSIQVADLEADMAEADGPARSGWTSRARSRASQAVQSRSGRPSADALRAGRLDVRCWSAIPAASQGRDEPACRAGLDP